jgi:fimbrial isopeptide formation D2 family protein
VLVRGLVSSAIVGATALSFNLMAAAPSGAWSTWPVVLTLQTTPHTGTGVTGATVTDSAQLNGQAPERPASGTVTYKLFNGTCGWPGAQVGSDDAVTVNSDGTVPDSGPFGPLGAGNYVFEVTYSGDSNYTGIWTPECEPFTIGPATLTLETTPHTSTGVTDATVTDSAQLNGQISGVPASGTVTYKLFNGTCDSVGTQVGSDDAVTVNSDGTVPDSGPFGPLAPGNYVFEVTYSGDSNYAGIWTPACEPFTIGPATLTLQTTPHTGTGVTGATVTDSAQLNGQISGLPASGTVTYQLFDGTCDAKGTQVGADDAVTVNSDGTVPDSGPFGPLGGGSYVFEVTYSGDSNYAGIWTPACEPFTIGPATLTLQTTPHTGSGVTGATVTDSAQLSGQISGFPASGTVTYQLFHGTCDAKGTQVGADDAVTVNSDGTVPDSGPFGPLGAGNYVFEVTYSGDSNYSPISTPECEPFSVGPVTPGLVTTVVTPHSTNLGNSWNDTATVTGVSIFAPAGSVRFQLCQAADAQTPCSGGSLVDVTLNAPTSTAGNVSTYALPAADAFTPTSAGTYCYNVSYAAGGDPNYKPVAEQSDTECFLVTSPFFTITKTDVPGDGNPVAPGSTIPYTVTIKNIGDGSGSATISDPLASTLTILGTPSCAVTDPSMDTCTVTAPAPGSTTWTFAVTLAAGHTATVTFSAQLAASATGSVANTATITMGPCNAPSGCSSTVTNPIIVTTTPTTLPPVPKPPVIAFTGADLAGMAIDAVVLGASGVFLLVASGRRRRHRPVG